jgi:multidrug resistance efflux pump
MKPISETHLVVIAAVTAALLISVTLAGCSAPRAAGASVDATDPIAVTIARVAMTDVTRAMDAGGVVQARTTARITARILAPVREVRVSPGDRVRAGQTLIVLDALDLAAGARAARSAALAAKEGANAATAERQSAEAGLTLALASHDRIAGLQAKGSATAQELDEATAALRSAEARVSGAAARALQAASAVEGARAASDQASTTQSFTTIAAPFDGTVTEKMVEPGNMASPGVPLLRLEDTRGFPRDRDHGDQRNGDRGQPGRGCGCARVSRQDRFTRRTRPSIRRIRQGAIWRNAATRVDRSIVGNRAARTAHVGIRGRQGRGTRACRQPQ